MMSNIENLLVALGDMYTFDSSGFDDLNRLINQEAPIDADEDELTEAELEHIAAARKDFSDNNHKTV